MAELDSSAIRKREAWARRSGAGTYVREMGAYALARDEEIVRAMIGRGPGELLDLPCGTGRFLEMEKELGFRVTAADYSPTMMSVAQLHQDVKFVQADAFDPPFAPKTFGAILILRLLFHYRNPEDILAALLPGLKDGGHIVFDTLNAFSLRWSASQVLHAVRRDPARRLYFETPASMAAKLRKLGLKVLQRQGAYVYPTRFYRYLPKPVIRATHELERLLPQALRVLTFWKVARE